MPFYRLHVPIMAIVTVLALIDGVRLGRFPEPPDRKPKIPSGMPSLPRRPNIDDLLTECALTLAELPYQPAWGGDEHDLLVVQEPYLEPGVTQPGTGQCPGSSLLWFMERERGDCFEEAAVLGFINCRCNCWFLPIVLADIAYVSDRDQYFVVLVRVGGAPIADMQLEVHEIHPRKVVTRHRSSLIEALEIRWPQTSEPIALKAAEFPRSGNWSRSYSLVRSLTAKVETIGGRCWLAVEACCADQSEVEHTHGIRCRWRYDIDRRKWSDMETVEAEFSKSVPTEREESNRKRMAEWKCIMDAVHRRRMRLGREALRAKGAAEKVGE